MRRFGHTRRNCTIQVAVGEIAEAHAERVRDPQQVHDRRVRAPMHDVLQLRRSDTGCLGRHRQRPSAVMAQLLDVTCQAIENIMVRSGHGDRSTFRHELEYAYDS